MASKFSPRNNKRKKKNKSRRGAGRRRGIGAEGDNGKAYDLCAPAWAAILIGGLAAYGTIKALGR